ncbi:MAG: glycoside hydrolase family 15 [Proteobacteria bacterium]|nr:MAG: glycoside hydrolase family 15 [Pseudomonadota bacterium]
MCFCRLILIFMMGTLVGTTCVPTYGATPLVTGNGFGFAVVKPETGVLTKFYAHPYSFTQPDAHNALSEGRETANFIKSLGWKAGTAGRVSTEYVEDSHVIRSRDDTGEATFFMPFGWHRDALIVSWRSTGDAKRGYWASEWSAPVISRKRVQVFGADALLLRFDGIAESLLVIPIGKSVSAAVSGGELSTNSAWVLLSLESESDLEPALREFHDWRAGLVAEALQKREMGELERWRVKPSVSFHSENERHLWRQSEVLLRVAQSREPNRAGRYNNGLIVAALPEGVFSTPWVRDMAYATAAFAGMGHRNEARAALLAYFHARPTGKMKADTGGVDYQISVVRYFGDGSEEPFFTMEGSTNIEYDDWGVVLWLLGDYLKRYDDPELLKASTYRGPLYESARDYVVKPLVGTLEPYQNGVIVGADTSIWEERQKDKKHFAYSTALAIAGLRNFAEVARRVGDEASRSDVQNQVGLLEKGFNAAFVRGGTLRGTSEEGVKNDIDGALLAVINFGVVNDPAIVRSTVDRMELLKVRSGGYRRVRGTYTDPSIYEYWYEKQEFLFVDFSLAEVLRTLGETDRANAILKRIVEKAAADHNILPEMYVAEDCQLFHGAIGDPTGAIPMVGYGAGAYVLDLLQREDVERSH